jgi:hypothetical protein
LAQPESLPVIYQNFNGGSSFIAKYKNIPGKRVGVQNVFAKSAQSIDPFSEIDRFCGQQYPHVRRHLNHDPCLQNVSQRARGSTVPSYRSFIFAPFVASISKVNSDDDGINPNFNKS